MKSLHNLTNFVSKDFCKLCKTDIFCTFDNENVDLSSGFLMGKKLRLIACPVVVWQEDEGGEVVPVKKSLKFSTIQVKNTLSIHPPVKILSTEIFGILEMEYFESENLEPPPPMPPKKPSKKVGVQQLACPTKYACILNIRSV